MWDRLFVRKPRHWVVPVSLVLLAGCTAGPAGPASNATPVTAEVSAPSTALTVLDVGDVGDVGDGGESAIATSAALFRGAPVAVVTDRSDLSGAGAIAERLGAQCSSSPPPVHPTPCAKS